MGNPVSRGQQRDKPFRDALRMEAKLADDGEESPAPTGSLRYIARQLLIRAGQETAACREVADRLDGKVPQAIVGDDDHDPIRLDTVTDEQRAKALAAFIARTRTKKPKSK